MGVYSKDNAGNIKQIAGNIVQRLNTRWFLCTRSIENDIEYYTVPASAQDYFKTIDSYTLYSLGFNEPNTTKYPVLRYGNIELDILDFTTEDGSINIGQLMGVFQMFTQDLSTDPKMYFVGNTHKDIDTGVNQEDFDNLVNNVTQIQARDDNSFKIGGASVANSSTVAIGKNAEGGASLSVVIGRDTEVSGSQQVAIGYKAKTGFNAGSIAIGNNAQLGRNVSGIQLGTGTNNTTQTLQIHNDNIYNYNTHTLTVNNIEQNGTPAYGVLSGTSAPTTTTVGAVGQFYLDTTNKKLYQCMSITQESVDEVDTNVYEWSNLSESGVSQTDFDNLVNNVTQIKSGNVAFSAVNPKSVGMSSVCIGNNTTTGLQGVAIGNYANASGDNASIAIGAGTTATGSFSIAIGGSSANNAIKAIANQAVQLGIGTNNIEGSLQIKNDNIYKTNTHTLTVNNIEQNGNPVYAVLQGTTAPDTTTVGAVTQFYLNTIDKKLYQCKSITTSETDSTSTYEWQEVGGSSGGSSGGEIQEIQLDDTLTTGTLTTEQLAVLQENAQNYITYKSYVYRFANSNTYGLTYISIDADNIAAGTMGAYVNFNQIYISKSTGTWSYSGPATLRELYIHNIKGSPHPNYQDAKFTFYLSYINNMSYSLTMASNFIALLSGNGYTGSSCLTCNGFIQMNSINYMITGISRTSSNDGINLYGVNLDDLGSPSLILTLSDTQFILGDTYKEMR